MAEKKSFEQSVGELEEIVRRLEAGDLSLDDSIAAFEKGMMLTRECEGILNKAKGKVEKLIRDSKGEFTTEPFEPKE